MVYRPNVESQRCFVMLPLRSPFLGYFDKIIKPAALDAGLTAVKADDIYGTRAVIRDIWDLIWTSRIAVAIVTDQNPNVNYELGMCHTLGVPTILVTEKPEDVPFDYRHRRYIRYTPREAGWEQKLLEDLRSTLKAVLLEVRTDDELPWPYDTFDSSAKRRSGRLVPAVDSLASVIRGTQLVRHAIAPAFGPQGRLVSVTLPSGGTQASFRRGHQIAQGINSPDQLEQRGIIQMKNLAAEMVSVVGDATKTAILLSCAMVERAGEALRGGSAPKALVAGMQKAVEVAVTHVMTEARSVDEPHLRSVARTAAGADENIATIIVEGLRKVGQDGAIEVLDGTGTEPGLEVQEGMQFDSGFLSQSFITDSQRQECVLEDCYILIYEGQIGSMRVLLPLLEQVAKAKKPLLVIASDLAQEAMATLIVNKEKGTLISAAVKAPGQGDRRRGYLEDIAILTRGRAFLQERMRPLDEASLDDLGRAEKVIVTRGDTTIIGGAGDAKEIASRVNSLRRQIETTLSPYDNAKLRERLAKLAGAIGVVRSGGLTETDRVDSRYKLESALFSCQSAINSGCVLGGGLRCYSARGLVEKLVAANESEQHGIDAVYYALEMPLRQLVENSNIHNKKRLIDEIIESASRDVGFNAEAEKVEDLTKAGILDPVQGLREALTLAFAHAKGILMTGAWDTQPSTSVEPPEEWAGPPDSGT